MNADGLKKRFKAIMSNASSVGATALYLKRVNPIHSWRAYANARKLEVATPNWVLDYFDTCAKALTTTTIRRRGRSLTPSGWAPEADD